MSRRLTVHQIETSVESVLDHTREKLEEIAETWRAQTLLPFCRRHRLTFISGMGRTVFYRDEEPVDSYDMPALKRLEEVLNLEGIGPNDCLGYYIRDVTEEDLA